MKETVATVVAEIEAAEKAGDNLCQHVWVRGIGSPGKPVYLCSKCNEVHHGEPVIPITLTVSSTSWGDSSTWQILSYSAQPNLQDDIPSGPTEEGTHGSIAWDKDYLYVCIAENTWRRIKLDDTW